MNRSAQGVMLIEALVGILVFSIGILALIGMQGTAVKHTADARYRSDAAYLANRIASQIRLDMAQIDAYEDGNPADYPPRTAWRQEVEKALPGVNLTTNERVPSIVVEPLASFAGDTSPSSRATIVIRWQQPGEAAERQFQLITYVQFQAI